MKRFCALLILLLACSSANAQSVMFGKRLVSKGDDVARVRDIAGSPDKIDRIAADEYSPAMEIWTYRTKEHLVVLWLVDAKVVQAQEQPIVLADGGTGAGNSNTASSAH